MEIFYCDAPKDHVVESYEGPCDQKPQSAMVCSKVRAAWAMGATPFHYPIEAGLSIGGPDSNPSVMIEVHYNNPDMKNGLIYYIIQLNMEVVLKWLIIMLIFNI